MLNVELRDEFNCYLSWFKWEKLIVVLSCVELIYLIFEVDGKKGLVDLNLVGRI